MTSDNESPTERKDLEVLWTPAQVARYFTIHTVTVYNWIRTKRVFNPDKIVRISNRVRIPRSEVERVAQEMRIKLENK